MIDPYLAWTGIYLDNIRVDKQNLLGYFFPEIENKSDNKIVLDIGCGAGHLGFKSRQHGAIKVIAIDNNPILIGSLKNVQKKYNLDWLEIRLCDAMDLPNDITIPDLILIGDSLPRNLLQAMWHLRLMDLAKSWPDVKIIPNKIRMVGSIINSNELDDLLRYGYKDMDAVIDTIIRDTLHNCPLTVKDPINSTRLVDETMLICYDYDDRKITCGSIAVPKTHQPKWLQLTMLLGDSDEIYKFDRQVNFIPLDSNVMEIKALVDKNKQINRLIMR